MKSNYKTYTNVYSFIADHVSRTTPYRLPRFVATKGSGIFFELDKAKNLIGPAKIPKDALPYRFHLSTRILKASPLAKLILPLLPLKLKSEDEALSITLKVVVESKKRYVEQFGGEFIVIIWPRADTASRRSNRVSDLGLRKFETDLRAAGIRVLHVPGMDDAASATIHPRDLHPSAEEYEWVAKHLWGFLALD